ncbi:MAG: type II secretion system F family protein [Deltaproteobacteria bacterium]|nr:type II secretion system F family protein [Deltaproteobacteria bacterium]
MSASGAAVFIFAMMVVAWGALYKALASRRDSFYERLAGAEARSEAPAAALKRLRSEAPARALELLRELAERFPRLGLRKRANEKLARMLTQAGLTRPRVGELFGAIRMASALGGAVTLALLDVTLGERLGPAALWLGVGGLVGYSLPLYYLSRRGRSRRRRIERELPDILDLLVVCVEAGLGLQEAIKVVGTEADRYGQSMGRELAIAGAEMAAGLSLGEAMRNLSERSGVEDLRTIAATLVQSEQLGAQLGPALRASSEALRSTRKLKAEEAAQKATVKMLFPLVLFVLPAMILVIIGPAIIQALNVMRRS